MKPEHLVQRIEEEEKKRKELQVKKKEKVQANEIMKTHGKKQKQEWKDNYGSTIDVLKNELRKANEELKQEKEKNKKMKQELEEVKTHFLEVFSAYSVKLIELSVFFSQ
jgi:archaellum component FlaC